MNRKAQTEFLGPLLLMFIGVLVGIILFQAVAQQAGGSLVNTQAVANYSIGAVDNVSTYYIPYRSISSVLMINGTTGVVVNAANYTVANNQINPTNGELSVSITPNPAGGDFTEPEELWFISGDAQAQTYIADSGARSVVPLITIFFALAIAVVALEPTLRGKLLESMGR